MKPAPAPALVLALALTLLPLTTKADTTIDSFPSGHPRILASAEDFERIRNADWDETGAEYLAFLRHTGEALLETEPVQYEMVGIRLLHRSREFLKRVATWSLLYRVDGTEVYRDRAIAEMESVAAFDDWNPSHYLDVGEMALGLAVGTDWLWDDLSEAQRSRFLDALLEKGIRPSLDEDHPDNWWIYRNNTNNWNPVCHSGIVAAALMNAEREPKLARAVIERAIEVLPDAMAETDPDGIYPEGTVYWRYGTEFTAIFLSLLEHAFGTTYGLAERPSLRKSMLWRTLVVSPTGKFYNFSDNRAKVRFSVAPGWFASYFGDRAGLFEHHRGLRNFLEDPDWDAADATQRLLPFLALWYPHDQEVPADADELALPLNWKGDGPVPMAFMRSGWGDPNAFFLSFKGGRATVSHAHMDNGSFIFEDEGVRWAIDLDSQRYFSLEDAGLGLWDRRPHADRWRVFRIGPHSHNLLLIDQRHQDVDETATIPEFYEDGNRVHGTVELTDVYRDQVSSYQRHFTAHDHKVVQITDQLRGARERTERQGRHPTTLRWRMLTEAVVDIRDNEAVLSQDGKRLYLRIVSPNDFRFRAAPVDPPPHFWDALNPGVSAIDIWCNTDNDGNQDVTVLMSTDPKALDKVYREL